MKKLGIIIVSIVMACALVGCKKESTHSYEAPPHTYNKTNSGDRDSSNSDRDYGNGNGDSSNNRNDSNRSYTKPQNTRSNGEEKETSYVSPPKVCRVSTDFAKGKYECDNVTLTNKEEFFAILNTSSGLVTIKEIVFDNGKTADENAGLVIEEEVKFEDSGFLYGYKLPGTLKGKAETNSVSGRHIFKVSRKRNSEVDYKTKIYVIYSGWGSSNDDKVVSVDVLIKKSDPVDSDADKNKQEGLPRAYNSVREGLEELNKEQNDKNRDDKMARIRKNILATVIAFTKDKKEDEKTSYYYAGLLGVELAGYSWYPSVDKEQLKKNYKSLNRTCHPDKVKEQDKGVATQATIDINAGYEKFK